MKNSQKGFSIPLLIAIISLLVISGGGAYLYKNAYHQGTIPSGPTQKIDNTLLSKYMVLGSSNFGNEIPMVGGKWTVLSKNIVISRGTGGIGFNCGDKPARDLPYKSVSPGRGIVGGWSYVDVLDCGDYYFVFSSNDADPTSLYGPFDLTNGQPANTTNQNANWKIYADPSRGVSFEYPYTWTYQKFSCNADGVAFCPITSSNQVGCKMTCPMNSVVPIILNTDSQKPSNSDLILFDNKYKEVYNKMFSTFKFAK